MTKPDRIMLRRIGVSFQEAISDCNYKFVIYRSERSCQ